MSELIYPISPTGLTKDFTKLPASYKLRASLAVFGIILFFLLYFAMVTALGYLVYYAATYEMVFINKFTILAKLGAIAGSAMLFVFTLKFIFKLKNHKPSNRIKLNPKEQPELMNFIYKICEETGAPKPKYVYIDPDVNAYVSYTNMWMSLIFPTRKELTLGFGLIGCLNLTEFKAVVAHEFGHFAQRSMKIGSYIISANTIIHDMIFNRDSWDNALEQWRASDIRLSFAAWIITPIIWIIRQILNLFYQFLNIMYSSLSREMEFNADKVAVSVTGSQAIVSSLWKLDNGFTTWNDTLNFAYLASQKNIYVENLYSRNNSALEAMSGAQTEKINSLPDDDRGGKLFFTTEENSKVGMYASHPPNSLREDNAKAPFIDGENDERSPWILFPNAHELQIQLSKLAYKEYFDKAPTEYVSIGEFEEFVKGETGNNELLEEYQDSFKDRFVTIPEDAVLRESAQGEMQPASYFDDLKSRVSDLMQPVQEINTKLELVQSIAQGTSKQKSFVHDGKKYGKRQLQEGWNTLMAEKEKYFKESFIEWDKDFFTSHFTIATKHGGADNLLKAYHQHHNIVLIYKQALGSQNDIMTKLQTLQNKGEITEFEVKELSDKTRAHFEALNGMIDDLGKKPFVSMPNIDTVDEFKSAIIDGGQFTIERGNLFEKGGFDRMMHQMERAVAHLMRVEQKSIAGILAIHSELREKLN